MLWWQSANYTHLIGPVYFGNEAAAWTRNAWYTHMLCVGEELSRPANLHHDVIFRKIGQWEGVQMALDEKQLKEAVEWMRRVWSAQDKPPKKITQADRKRLVVYSRWDSTVLTVLYRPIAVAQRCVGCWSLIHGVTWRQNCPKLLRNFYV